MIPSSLNVDPKIFKVPAAYEYPSTLFSLTTFVCDLPYQVRPSSCAHRARSNSRRMPFRAVLRRMARFVFP